MAVTVICAGLATARPGRATVDLLPGSAPTLEALLFDRPPAGGPALVQTLFNSIDVRREAGCVVLVNGTNIAHLAGWSTPVRDGATVLVTAHVVGG